MPGALGGAETFLAPAVLAAALLLAGSAAPWVTYVAYVLLTLALVLAAVWWQAFWAFQLAEPRAPLLKKVSKKVVSGDSAPRVCLEWSAPDDFPEDFAPLLGLKELMISGDGITGALVRQLCVTGEAELCPGSHELRVSATSSLKLVVTERQAARKCKMSLEAKPAAEGQESVASHLCLELPAVQLAGVAGALDALWHLWAAKQSTSQSLVSASARWICVVLLKLLESTFPIRLSRAEGTAVGEELLLFFSGTVGPIPFERIHLPTFVLPRLHAPLARLLSAQPVSGQRLRRSAFVPAPHPGILAAWSASVDVTVAPFGVEGTLRLRDGSCSMFAATPISEGPLQLRCETSGKLDADSLVVQMQSFSVASASRPKQGLSGRATMSVSLARTRTVSTDNASGSCLPDIFFKAACEGSLGETPLDVLAMLSIDEGSELPQELRLTFRDEHPLMLGCATIAVRLERAALQGTTSLSGELPMLRKRDLLKLPEADLIFEAAVLFEEETCFVDDGFTKARCQGVRGTANGRVWSDAEDSLRAEASVSVSGRLAAEVRDAPLVQALIEAETLGVRNQGGAPRSRTFSGMHASPSSDSPGFSRKASHSLHAHPSSDSLGQAAAGGPKDETHMQESYTSVRRGDVIHVDVGATVQSTARCHLRVEPMSRAANAAPVASPVQRGRQFAEMLTVAEPDLAGQGSGLLRVSIAGTAATLELGEFRARVGDLALTMPPFVKVTADVVEAEINAEGIGQTYLRTTWSGLGQPVVSHTAKQLSAMLPPLPSTGGATIRIGDMGQMSIAYDGELDGAAIGNSLLDEEAWHGCLLELGSMLNLEQAVQSALNFARVLRNVLRSEGISEPKDLVPTPRLARILARILLEIGTNGQHVAEEGQSQVEQDLQDLLGQAVLAKGLDVNKITRLLWDFLPPDACAFVQDYTAEVDFAIKWCDSLIRPTEASSGRDPSKAREPPPSHHYRRELQEVAPCAARLYEAVARPGQLARHLEEQLSRAAPYLTTMQVEHVLLCPFLSPALRQRLKFLLGLKRRVEKVAEGYGGPAFMPQGMAVGFFLATAIRGSFAGSAVSPTGMESASSGYDAVVTSASGRLAAVLHEQRSLSLELCRLQERQRRLSEEALQLAGLGNAMETGPLYRLPEAAAEEAQATDLPDSTPPAANRWKPGAASSGAAALATSMLECLSPHTAGVCATATAAVHANAARCAQRVQAAEAASVQLQTNIPLSAGRLDSGTSASGAFGAVAFSETFDLGCSLLGPAEVAVLLQSGLSAVPQGRQVQQNQRMLIEMMVSQPPLFLKGVLYELSNNGSSRVLGNHLLALLDLTQDAVRPGARLDVADLLTAALGVHMPRRADFMAGGSLASSSYLLFVHRAAKLVLEECEPYVALKHWLQRAEVPISSHRGGDVVPAAQREVLSAARAVKDADAVGASWLQERGHVWRSGHVLEDEGLSVVIPGNRQGEARATAQKLYETALRLCKEALKANPEMLYASWFQEFWSRNYDALTVVSVLRNVQTDVDSTRKWLDAQLRYAEKCDSYRGPSEACDALWSRNPSHEACLVDCLIEVLFYQPAVRERYRKDALMQLVLDEPPGHFDFTVVSAMGVITEGAAGTEMAATYGRLERLRGVNVIRADTATLQSVDYNATCIERAVRNHVRSPWGWVGYSQGCANAFRAEAMMLQGTPQQQKLMHGFRCRQLLFSAANGSAHATCGDSKILRALTDGERFLKRFQASMSAATQGLALDMLQNLMSSRLAYAVLGSVQSMTHEGARTMWRDGQHCHTAPTCSIRGVIETHSLPEALIMASNILEQQMDYCKEHDTQVAIVDAVAHPTGVQNANAELLERVDIQSGIQRTHHWSPLNAEVKSITTTKDEPLAMFDRPKDLHVFPWLEVNARFGVIDRRTGSASPNNNNPIPAFSIFPQRPASPQIPPADALPEWWTPRATPPTLENARL